MAVVEVKRLQIHNGHVKPPFPHSPTGKNVRSGVAVMQQPLPLAKVNGFVLAKVNVYLERGGLISTPGASGTNFYNGYGRSSTKSN